MLELRNRNKAGNGRICLFVDNRLLVAHNALFDLGFIRQEGYRTEKQEDIKIKFNMPVLIKF